jgi:predicted transcriptional regulator of viral defense system
VPTDPPHERWRSGSDSANQRAKVRVGAVAARQWGRVHWLQLRDCGLAKATISKWVVDGYLTLVHPRVYAVGHLAPSYEADLIAAVLYAGPGAMLSHVTAAWWWRLTDRQPILIDVSSPKRFDSPPGLRIHSRRSLDRISHNRIPVTTIPQTLLDVAATESLDTVRYMLAEADYHRLIDFGRIEEILGRGKPGSARLRQAIEIHNPDLARTKSPVEREFLALCEESGIPRPLVNVRVCGFRVDCFWPEHRLVVELDGRKGHSTERQVARDHGRDLKLRAARIAVRRYARRQIAEQRKLVVSDLWAALAQTGRRAA